MRGGHRGRQAVFGDMRVDLRCGDVRMAEHGLHAAQIRAAFHQMRGKGMAQDMRRQLVGIESGFQRQLLEQLMATPARQMAFRGA